jgi:hypothetical protein
VTLSAANAHVESGEAVSLKASLRPPPEPISPNGFDFGRKAWFNRLGATGYAIGKIEARASRHGICVGGRPSTTSARWSRPAFARASPANAARLPRR